MINGKQFRVYVNDIPLGPGDSVEIEQDFVFEPDPTLSTMTAGGYTVNVNGIPVYGDITIRLESVAGYNFTAAWNGFPTYVIEEDVL